MKKNEAEKWTRVWSKVDKNEAEKWNRVRPRSGIE